MVRGSVQSCYFHANCTCNRPAFSPIRRIVNRKQIANHCCSKLSGQIVGSSWYVLSVKRQYECWSQKCFDERNGTHSPSCNLKFLDCKLNSPERDAWLKNTKVVSDCDAIKDEGKFTFGMFKEAFNNDVASASFINKYFYCLWWGMRNLWYVILLYFVTYTHKI